VVVVVVMVVMVVVVVVVVVVVMVVMVMVMVVASGARLQMGHSRAFLTAHAYACWWWCTRPRHSLWELTRLLDSSCAHRLKNKQTNKHKTFGSLTS
jgi:hypothetical protein